jgi:hypothetical protein
MEAQAAMSISQQHHARDCLVEGLKRQLDRWAAGQPAAETSRFSSGAAALDRLLPGGGLRHGMLVEWLGEQPGGAATVSLLAAREACRAGGVLVVVDRRQMFYPPAAAAWGVDLRRLIVVHPRDRRDELWVMVQSLRSPVVAAVWAMVDRLDGRAFRRLQLAAQAGRTLGMLLRPADVRGQPSWADVQLAVEGRGTRSEEPVGEVAAAIGKLRAGSSSTPEDCKLKIDNCKCSIFNPPSPRSSFLAPRSFLCRVRVLRTRRGRAGAAAMLEIDDVAHVLREATPNDDANPLPVVAELADPTAPPRPARAQ